MVFKLILILYLPFPIKEGNISRPPPDTFQSHIVKGKGSIEEKAWKPTFLESIIITINVLKQQTLTIKYLNKHENILCEKIRYV
jgi:hypothetical protein